MAFRFHILLFFLLLSAASYTVFGTSKVKLDLYYETLCPYCSNFIVNYLSNLFRNGLIAIVDLNLVPYGNARVGPNNTITCQHGPYECLLNTVEACAINIWPDMIDHFPFLYCVESLVLEGKYSEWQSCFQKTSLDSQPVADCYNSGYGEKLDLQYAAETNALQPPHRYVPWVRVDGLPLYEDYENFENYICKAYKGDLPKACKTLSLTMIPHEKANPLGQVCYLDKMITSPAASEGHGLNMERSK